MAGAEPLEQAVALQCAGERLWGILTRPAAGAPDSRLAVLIAVGGPQYRVGSHRQFVQLARALAREGFASLRFDYRGMGDSEGELRDFEAAADDLKAGLDALSLACPAAQRLVVWGLCDAAAAALMFATRDRRVTGIVAANPWARSGASLAATHVKHYYAARLLQGDFWAKLLRGGLDWRQSFASLLNNLRQAFGHHTGMASRQAGSSFQSRMAEGLTHFAGQTLLLLSGSDLTAKEFVQYAAAAPDWKGVLEHARVSRIDIEDADHTFSRRVWAAQAETATIEWLRTLAQTPGAG